MLRHAPFSREDPQVTAPPPVQPEPEPVFVPAYPRPVATSNHAAADWSLATGRAYANWLGQFDPLSTFAFDEVQAQIDYWHLAYQAGGAWAEFAVQLRDFWSLAGDFQDAGRSADVATVINDYGRWAEAMFPVDPVYSIMDWLNAGN